eukprot:m.35480 g.35480  ORF g.35480 m.35480 type:complete len:190 (+) comp8886_c0_seq2:273-842(+)
MFCADYIACFVVHVGIVTLPITTQRIQCYFPQVFLQSQKWNNMSKAAMGYGQNNVATPIIAGTIAGVVGALGLAPFDILRQGVLPNASAWTRGMSVVPYSATFFGMYFTCRNPESRKSQAIWAMGSSVCAGIVEMPFDKAKRNLFRAPWAHVLANVMYAPFAAMILIAYDTSYLKIMTRQQEPWKQIEA